MATSASKRRPARSAALIELEKQVLAALTDMKAVNIKLLDVRGLTDVADTMIIASGTSDRHVRAIADNVVMKAKQMGYRPRGVEGTRDSEWVLVDLQDVLVHVMLPRVREFYALEQLWEAPAEQRKADKQPGAKAKPKSKTKTAAASERQRTARPAAKRPRTTRRSARR
jgi:ribosome-associated protein